MDPVLKDLVQLLDLERIEDNIFRGQSRDIGTPQVFGGQVLGQALSAASQTVTDRVPHSLHAYFLRRGDVDLPIVYEVDRARDGGSFSNRRVVAIQHGKQIFNMAISFQELEPGVQHQFDPPDVPGPDELLDLKDISRDALARAPERMSRFVTTERPFYVRPVQMPNFDNPEKQAPTKQVWMKAVDPLPDNPSLHQRLLAYVSDYGLIATSTLPHGIAYMHDNVIMASLDHALWFHHPCRVDEWLLFSYDSPSASGARGLSRAQVFTQEGLLVASVAQEGLIRLIDPVE
jgi:acyl-CoA thioesterase-2